MAKVSITLTNAEALVLFEWLARIDELKSPPYADPSEERVAWDLQAQLETILVEPFAANYAELLAEAKRQVMHGETPDPEPQ